jgi:hypothetical protein
MKGGASCPAYSRRNCAASLNAWRAFRTDLDFGWAQMEGKACRYDYHVARFPSAWSSTHAEFRTLSWARLIMRKSIPHPCCLDAGQE